MPRSTPRKSTQPDVPEPTRLYNSYWISESDFNQGFEHPWYEERALALFQILDDDERWAAQAEIARWLFDNVLDIPLFVEPTLWPLGPEIDEWELMGNTSTWLNNTEYTPHRQ